MKRGGTRIDGLRAASAALNELSKTVARNAGKRALKVPAEILRDEMKVKAPRLSGDLEASIDLTKEKARRGRPRVGVIAADIASIQNEFGNSNMAAQPFARPAEEATRDERLTRFGDALKLEVDAAAARVAKRAARTGG